jgi:hypothetical protein
LDADDRASAGHCHNLRRSRRQGLKRFVSTAIPFTYAHYREIVVAALAAGYRFCSFPELAQVRSGTQYSCSLRHDCDNDLVAALRLARVERDLGIRSTYFVMLRSAMYNLLSPANAALVREILGQGHWLGLHFDESVHAGEPLERLSALVDRERQWLTEEFGQSVEVVSFHQPSHKIVEGTLALNCINTYSRQDLAGVHYVSDSNLKFRDGCPSEIFRGRHHRHVQILLHPEWWTEQEMPLGEKWNQMLINNLELMQQSLLAREATYKTPQRLRLEPAEPQGGVAE